MNSKTLRPYQAKLVTDVCRADGDVLVEQPTGSGKTMQIVTLVAMQLGRRFTHAVIAAPQEQIEHGFVRRDYERVAWSQFAGVAVPSVEVPDELIWGARQSQLGSVKRLLAYLRQSAPVDHALACTHAALNRLSAEDLPDDLSGKALFIDEAHHASADGLSRIVSVWRECGGQLFFFTATPYRGDGRPVALEGMRLLRRSLAEHMADRDENGKPFAPGILENEIVALGNPGDTITAGQFTGEEAPPSSYFEHLVHAIRRKWLDDGKPKAIVRVPPMRGGSGGFVGKLIHALASNGARVLNATGTGAKDKQRFLTALESEKNRRYSESEYDVIVGIQRVMEGTDWPLCAAVYCVGMPGSLNTVVQLLGRAMRPKGDGYPAAHRDRARLVFFVPCGGGSALADLSLDHSRHALLTCCFLADHEVGQEWIVLREIRRGIEEALGPRDENPSAAAAENEANAALEPEVRAEVELVMAAVREQIISEGGKPTLGEVVQLAAKTRPDLPEAALHRVAVEILAAQPSPLGAEAKEAIRNEVAKRLRIDPKVKQVMEAAFGVVLHEFRNATLDNSAVLESIRRQVHGVTGGQMREFAQRLREAAPRPLTEELILVWADAQHELMGDWPSTTSGPIFNAVGETWNGIEQALYIGSRGLYGGSSLAKLLAKHRGVRNIHDLPPLSVEEVLAWADHHRDQTGEWPTTTSGVVLVAPGESWMGIHRSLQSGRRGFSGGSSLARFLAKYRNKKHPLELPSLTIEEILVWADEHHRRNGDWPTAKSGSVHETPCETWGAISDALHRGRRGFPGGSSLAQILDERRGVRNIHDLIDLTVNQILEWADAHHQRTGNWPKQNSGIVIETPGESWGAINATLNIGRRGLPGGCSLARLLEEHRGVRNIQDLPPLTIQRILEWADEHHSHTGTWPTDKSGAVQGVSGETWKGIYQSLYKGRRGLPGGSSLAQLLAENRGIRNHLDLPELTIDQILTWADGHHKHTGKWPKTNSGRVDAAAGETWLAIDAALRTGGRSLPVISSLAKLLSEHRGVRNHKELPNLAIDRILNWIVRHHKATGQWPDRNSGPIFDAPGENWRKVENALRIGLRGLPAGSSLARLVTEHRNCE